MPKPELSVPAFFKVGRGKAARWKVRLPAIGVGIERRPPVTKLLKKGERPLGDYYLLIRNGPSKGRAVLMSGQTGRRLPAAERPARERHVQQIVSYLKKHLREETGFSWLSTFKQPKWQGWHSEFEIVPKNPKDFATWLELAETFKACRLDAIMEKLSVENNERFHFGFDHYTPEPLVSKRNRDYMALIRTTDFENAFEQGEIRLREFWDRYKDAKVFGIILSMRKRYAAITVDMDKRGRENRPPPTWTTQIKRFELP